MTEHDKPTIGLPELATAAQQALDETRYLMAHPRPFTDPMPRWKYERLRELAETAHGSDADRSWLAMAEPVDDWAGAPAPCYDFSSVWDAIGPNTFEDEPEPETGHKPCMPHECPPLGETTIRFAAPVVPPPWVREALDRIGRDWSAYLTGTAGVAYDGTGRVETRPALAGGYWLTEVPDETPLIVETLCEECTGYEGGDGNA